MSSRVASFDNQQDSATKSKAKADVLVLRSIAGRLRVAWELATGAQTVDGEGYCIGKNPSGDYGCNASGPPWGPAFISAYAGRGGMKADTTNWLGQKNATPPIVAGTDEAARPLPMRFWVQPYDLLGSRTPLFRLYPIIVMHCVSGGPVSVVVRARQHHGAETSATFSVTNTSEETFSDNDLYVDTRSGAVTPVRFFFEVPAGESIVVDRISINCVANLENLTL